MSFLLQKCFSMCPFRIYYTHLNCPFYGTVVYWTYFYCIKKYNSSQSGTYIFCYHQVFAIFPGQCCVKQYKSLVSRDKYFCFMIGQKKVFSTFKFFKLRVSSMTILITLSLPIFMCPFQILFFSRNKNIFFFF